MSTPSISLATSTTTAIITLPVGTIVSFAGAVAPEGWLMCNGQPIAQITYPALYGIVGGNVPDLRSRFIIGAGQGAGLSERNLYQQGGEEQHTLSVNEMPSHNHMMGIGGGNHGTSPGSGNSEGWATNDFNYWGVTTDAGSGNGHNNMPPFYALSYIIKF